MFIKFFGGKINMSLLELKNVKSEVEGKEILKGLNLTINKGKFT